MRTDNTIRSQKPHLFFFSQFQYFVFIRDLLKHQFLPDTVSFFVFCSGIMLNAGIGAAPSSGSKVDEPGFIGFCLSTLVCFCETKRFGFISCELLRRF
jgi:hypothetical protein